MWDFALERTSWFETVSLCKTSWRNVRKEKLSQAICSQEYFDSRVDFKKLQILALRIFYSGSVPKAGHVDHLVH